jgi:hypothetical protein
MFPFVSESESVSPSVSEPALSVLLSVLPSVGVLSESSAEAWLGVDGVESLVSFESESVAVPSVGTVFELDSESETVPGVSELLSVLVFEFESVSVLEALLELLSCGTSSLLHAPYRSVIVARIPHRRKFLDFVMLHLSRQSAEVWIGGTSLRGPGSATA